MIQWNCELIRTMKFEDFYKLYKKSMTREKAEEVYASCGGSLPKKDKKTD